MSVVVLLAALSLGAAGEDLAARQAAEFEAKVLAELAAVAPSAVQDARAAGEAYRADRNQEAIDGYGRVLAAAPGFPHALRRTCGAKLGLGDRAGALPHCRAALAAAATPENQLALARALSFRTDTVRPPAAELAEAARLAKRAFDGDPGDVSISAGACQVALGAGDEQQIGPCAERLARLLPGTVEAEYFGIFGALVRGRHGEARAHLRAARAAGLQAEPADELARLIDENEPLLSRWGLPALWAALGWVSFLLLLLGAGALLSAATLRRARAMATDRRGEASTGAGLLRRVYALVLWLTCAAYYVSLPLVLLAIVAGAAGLWMAMEAVGRIPVKLVFIVGLVVLVSVWAVAKSLWVSLVRPRLVDPGLPLDVAEHPRLAAALRQAAERVGTRPVDRVFVTPFTEAAVFERGSLARRLSGRSERCLILGIGLLDGMTQGQLKAILAHEYGHFVNRDTAGGGLALSVRRAVLTMGRSLAQGSAATWYNPAWLFVNGFHRLFLRVSQGASRLQEILADRWAALAYGGADFAGGMRHVVARDIRFDRQSDAALREVIDGGLALRNLYAYAPSQALDEGALAAAVKEAMEAEPSPYDSHPRPADRIAWVGDVTSAHGRDLDAAQPAWALFRDREALERRLTDEVRANVERNHGVAIPAEAPAPPAAPAEPVPEATEPATSEA